MRTIISLAALSLFLLPGTSIANAGEADKLKCKTAYFQGSNDRATYACDGSYVYQAGTKRYLGTYTVNGSKVCVKFKGGSTRCDTIAGNVLTNSRGQSYRFQLH